MPGICAVVDKSQPTDVPTVLGRMVKRMTHHDWYVVEQRPDEASGVGLGRVSLGIVNTARQPVVAADGQLVVVMDGELVDQDERRRELEAAGCQLLGDSQAEILLHGYRTGGRDFFRSLGGKFTAVIWDAARRRLIVTNDRFGMKPIYYARLPGKLLVASEIKAILADPAVSRKPSTRGISQFFAYGHYLADDTSLAAVRLLPPAGWLVFDAKEDHLSVDRYWLFDTARPETHEPNEWLDRLDAAFKRAVDRRVNNTTGLGLSLSGGLDARTILGVIDEQSARPTTVAMGIPGCRDHRSATELAALVGCPHHNYVLRTDFLDHFEEHLQRMVYLTDGQYLSQCIVMPTLPFYREQGIDVLLRGHAGELMHMNKAYNFSLSQRELGIRSEAELEDWAFRHLRAYMLEAVDGPLLAHGPGTELDEAARDSLRGCLRESEGMEPAVQRIWHLFITQRSRRETALSLVKFGSQVETRLPYIDNELVDLLMAVPPELKIGETIQADILRRRRPEFLDVINVNTGTRMGAGLVARKWAGLRQKVLAKLQVRGYQPYERLGLWLRRELVPLVERILLDDRCLARGVFHADTVRSVVRQHFRNQRNHTYLIMALMIFEISQRQFVDETNSDSLPSPS